jgi:cell division protein FtsB
VSRSATGEQTAVTGPMPPAVPAAPKRRPRLTGRAAILVLVLAVLVVSYASSMRAYLDQRAHIQALKDEISQRESDIDKLEKEKRRFEDPPYIQKQARERFGYVMPGETSYVVLDENGEPLESESSLSDPAAVLHKTPRAWWTDAWASVELAGNPPAAPAPPLTEIDGSDEPTGSG